MKNIKAIDVLNQCIEQISNMTDEEFIKIKKQRGILDKEYNIEEYINEDVEIILPKLDSQDVIIHKEILDYKVYIEYDTKNNSMQRNYGLSIYSNDACYNPIAA